MNPTNSHIKVLALLQARTSSTRLPGKVMKPILGVPMILRQIERLRRAVMIDQLTVVTSTEASDNALASLCAANGVSCFRGSLNDVLDRFYQAAHHVNPLHVVRLTADCPLTDPCLIDQVIRFHLEGEYDYVSNSVEPTYPDGLDVEVFRFNRIEQAWLEATLPSMREHVTPFLYQQPQRFKIGQYKGAPNLSHLRWTVDEPLDFKLVERIYTMLYPANPAFTTQDILQLLGEHPELQALNTNIQRNEGMVKSLQQDVAVGENKHKNQVPIGERLQITEKRDNGYSPTGLPSNVLGVISAANILGISRQNNHAAWDQTVEYLAYVPVFYSQASIDYQLAYQRGQGGEWWDISLILYHDRRPCSVWPLSFSLTGGKGYITSHGLPVLPPLFVNDFPDKSRKTVVKGCLDLLEELCHAGGILKWESAESFTGSSESGMSEWHNQSKCRSATTFLRHELFVDLTLDIAAIKAGFRKSYKSLITSGMRTWQVDVMTETNPVLWEEFRELHHVVSARVTRSAETWDLHHQAITHGNAFLVFLRNGQGTMVGGGFFNITRDEGAYSVAAYDRSLFAQPLGHVVQYRAIEEMKKRGLRWYKIGFRPYPSDLPAPTEKEISIGEFKEGFATHLFPQYLLHNEIKNTDRT